jgi:hypothetical protein
MESYRAAPLAARQEDHVKTPADTRSDVETPRHGAARRVPAPVPLLPTEEELAALADMDENVTAFPAHDDWRTWE